MIAIGLRVYSNKVVHYSIIRNANDTLEYQNISHINVPLTLEQPERLNYLRSTLMDIIDDYRIDHAIIRVKENFDNMNGLAVERFYIEGVLLEALAGSTVAKYKLGKISTITPLLGIDRKMFKKLIDDEIEFEKIPEDLDWKTLSKEDKESILACCAAFNL